MLLPGRRLRGGSKWPLAPLARAYRMLATGASASSARRAPIRPALTASRPVRASSIATARKISASVRASTVMWLVVPHWTSCALNTCCAP